MLNRNEFYMAVDGLSQSMHKQATATIAAPGPVKKALADYFSGRLAMGGGPNGRWYANPVFGMTMLGAGLGAGTGYAAGDGWGSLLGAGLGAGAGYTGMRFGVKPSALIGTYKY